MHENNCWSWVDLTVLLVYVIQSILRHVLHIYESPQMLILSAVSKTIM